ncbi:UDP-N-acetylglucosamine 2-epimerase (non-hydrolyzing) [Rhodoblastus sphagnicola]|uniref:UDP-N-acetylglucosamine 2-epimerase (Non-hydrolyzing) n=1 Tax=Rhodoblastus sphagnicola TaxID=333368 RepID=A0A2S6NAQ0_9HYPH|nr:UDP-N-acetylglucosamine 2-epimerase (non-hydrolyzing) [Rhodoblastus sphagnicola]MBB4200294.1 UDP-N-acetylglucosamine 2-epimerase (non-hydrolyzing) [Rhodoblastus sphagnicola]PPQ31677.1 UDP-N-acetylglucosamine 2-epimerase (non-hydrolyzing) [Rhodoblastus sphagnicola]
MNAPPAWRVDCIVGARPNFVKIAPILRALKAGGFSARLIHTGQHYDRAMSEVFFNELQIPEPDIDLGVGSGSGIAQTAQIMIGLEPVLLAERPDMLLVVGDVNSTLAAGLVAAKLLIPLCHVEAGLRSGDWTMPEEVNRFVTDGLSDLLLTTEREAEETLLREGIPRDRIHFVGNVMIDSLLASLVRAPSAEATLAAHDGALAFRAEAMSRGFGLVTLHRPSNVDDPARLSELLETLAEISARLPLVFAVHPRTRARIAENGLARLLENRLILTTPPLPYLQVISLMKSARLVITDSGGVQEETTALGVPCLTARASTERPITITQGTNTLVGLSTVALKNAVMDVLENGGKRGRTPELWDGRAAERVSARIGDYLTDRAKSK